MNTIKTFLVNNTNKTPVLFMNHVTLYQTAFERFEKGYSAMKIRWWVHAVIEARKR